MSTHDTPPPSPQQPASRPGLAPQTVETTGHVWDETLQEYNNPLPRWWLWGFYGTVVFAVLYWILYPAWPVGDSFTKGIHSVSFLDNGEIRETHWNTRALLVQDMQSGPQATRQREFLERIGSMPYERMLTDPEIVGFVNAYAKTSFGTWCAACHQTGGGGVLGQYPNLRDDHWKWGGSLDQIEQVLVEGRVGYMPGYRESLTATQLQEVAAYVLSLNGYTMNPEQVAAGATIYSGHLGGCFQCHGRDAAGLVSQGAPNLRNNIWGLIDVAGAASDAERQQRVAHFVQNGAQRLMPAFGERLSLPEIRVLSAYVHGFGGGQ